MEIERDVSRAQAVRPSVSAVIFRGDRLLLQRRADGGQWGLPGETLGLDFFDPGALPGDLVPLHRIRIGDALARAATPFIR